MPIRDMGSHHGIQKYCPAPTSDATDRSGHTVFFLTRSALILRFYLSEIFLQEDAGKMLKQRNGSSDPANLDQLCFRATDRDFRGFTGANNQWATEPAMAEHRNLM